MNKFVQDIEEIHAKFNVNQIVEKLDGKTLAKYLEFRRGCLQEELDELRDADNADDAVDALIDLVYFAIGTLDAFAVDTSEAWARVHAANIVKEPGIKPERPNEYGFPDMIKPAGWKAPTHVGNTGLFDKVFGE